MGKRAVMKSSMKSAMKVDSKKCKPKAVDDDIDPGLCACLQLADYRDEHGIHAREIKDKKDVPIISLRRPPPALRALSEGGEWDGPCATAVNNYITSLSKQFKDDIPDLLQQYRNTRGKEAKREWALKLSMATDNRRH